MVSLEEMGETSYDEARMALEEGWMSRRMEMAQRQRGCYAVEAVMRKALTAGERRLALPWPPVQAAGALQSLSPVSR